METLKKIGCLMGAAALGCVIGCRYGKTIKNLVRRIKNGRENKRVD